MGTKSTKVTSLVLMINKTYKLASLLKSLLHINLASLFVSFTFLRTDFSGFENNKDLLNHKMTTFAFLVLAVSLYVSEAEDIDFKPCVSAMTNGCSIPLGIAFPYKDLFLPACERHDVCYSCVSVFYL